jgi:phospholipid/cholesterol/gamma-HCH transport system substrate-binding protein
LSRPCCGSPRHVNTQKKYEPYQSIVRESVAGLSIAAPVKYLGVDVGKVSEIGIDPQNSRQVRLRFLIERGTPIKQDTEAVLKTPGPDRHRLRRARRRQRRFGAARPDGRDAVPTIRSKPSLSARLEDVLTTVLANLDRTSANLNSVLDADNRAALKQALADIATLAHTLSAQQVAIGAGIADAARTARNTSLASEKLGAAIDRIAASADAVEKMANAAGRASASAGRTVDAAASGVQQFSSETLPELDRLLAEMNALATSMRHLSEQTEHDPSSLLLGAPTRPMGPGEKARP